MKLKHGTTKLYPIKKMRDVKKEIFMMDIDENG